MPNWAHRTTKRFGFLFAALLAFPVFAAYDFSGTTQRIEIANVWDNSKTAQTIAMWVYPDSDLNSQYFFNGYDSGDTNLGGIIFWTGSGTEGRLLLTGRLATTDVVRGCATLTFSTGSWQHIAATWDGGTDAGTGIKIYHDGTECTYDEDTDGSGAGLAAMNGDHEIGGRHTGSRYFNGRIAELGHWDRGLGAGEIAALAKGFPPIAIPNGLRIYPLHGMTRSVPSNYTGGQLATITSATVVDHPKILRTVGPLSGFSAIAAAAGGSVPAILHSVGEL